MIKVVIVDDEKMICSMISQLLNWNELGFEIVGMAYTGVDAFEMIQMHRPDVVISDIRMPGYDGLELIRRAKELESDAEFIMISGFRQFEYAQNAMKYGVKYYLLKPIEEEKLLEIVMEIKSVVLSRRARVVYENTLELEVKETRDKMKKRFLTSIIYEDVDSKRNAIDRDEVNREYRTNFKEGNYRAIFVKLDSDEVEDESINSIVAEVEKRINTLGYACEEYITTETHSGTITLVNYRQDQEGKLREQIEEAYEEIQEYVEQFHGFSVTIGVGERHRHFFDSNVCIKTAIDAIKYRIRFHNLDIIYAEDYQFVPCDMENLVTSSKKREYLAKVEAGDSKAVIECLTGTLRQLRYRSESYSPVSYFDVFLTYVKEFTDYCKRQEFYDDVYEKRLKKWNMQMDNVKSEKLLLEVTQNLIIEAMKEIEARKLEKDIRPIRLVKQYIEENFKQEISLGQLAELVEMNVSYVSSIFKKETGMTYSEFLTSCRIKEASRLLVETNKSVGVIAEESGYQDARYFSKQFLKQIGLKPSEYRKLYS